MAQPGSPTVHQGSLGPLTEGRIKGGDEKKGKGEILEYSSGALLDFSRISQASGPFDHNSAQGKNSPGTGYIKGWEDGEENQGSTNAQSGDDFLVFKECHYGSPSSDARSSARILFEFQSPDCNSPESPFEVLGDSSRSRGLGCQAVDSAEHLQTSSLRTAADLDRDILGNGAKEGREPCVPRPLMDHPGVISEFVDRGDGQAKSSLEIGGDDDPWKSDQEEAEILYADSSDESDDTVIEDMSDHFSLSKTAIGSGTSLLPKVEGPTAAECPVSTALSSVKEINEPDLIEEEEGGEFEVVKERGSEGLSRPVPKPEVVHIPRCDILESELPPSETCTLDFKHSQQHSVPLQVDPVTLSSIQHSEGHSDTANSDQPSYYFVAASSNEIVASKDLNFELSQEAYATFEHGHQDPLNNCSLTEECKPDEMHFSEPKHVELLAAQSNSSSGRPSNFHAGPHVGKMSTVTKAPPANVAEILSGPSSVDWSANPRDVRSLEAFPEAASERGSKVSEDSPESASDPESIEPECSVTAATDTFVGFMKECLHSSQPKELDERHRRPADQVESPQLAAPFSGPPPAALLNLEQERLTICALKELSSSQEDFEDPVDPTVPQTVPEPQPGPDVPSPPLKKPPAGALLGGDVERVDDGMVSAALALLTNLSVRELVYWRDPRKSGVVFGGSLLALLSLASCSVISVVSYLLLALLCVTITFRVYKSVIQAVQKSNEGHPFKALMEKDITIPPETFRRYTDKGLTHLNQALRQLRRLFLVEDLVDSLKLAVLMWLLTYVGAIFNGITLLILADILLFSSPLVYEKNKTQIDHYMGLVRSQVDSTLAKLQEKLPGAVKRSKAE
ncbi:hypothetical protein GJAV_G00126510 [Gymnothorax javanicus]|nr:hypothetical protein GJAV_G00126510 [Gymnothorax javanicus]